jgi:hypothetical protein
MLWKTFHLKIGDRRVVITLRLSLPWQYPFCNPTWGANAHRGKDWPYKDPSRIGLSLGKWGWIQATEADQGTYEEWLYWAARGGDCGISM